MHSRCPTCSKADRRRCCREGDFEVFSLFVQQRLWKVEPDNRIEGHIHSNASNDICYVITYKSDWISFRSHFEVEGYYTHVRCDFRWKVFRSACASVTQPRILFGRCQAIMSSATDVFLTVENWYKYVVQILKILASLFRGWVGSHGLFGLTLAVPLLYLLGQYLCEIQAIVKQTFNPVLPFFIAFCKDAFL